MITKSEKIPKKIRYGIFISLVLVIIESLFSIATLIAAFKSEQFTFIAIHIVLNLIINSFIIGYIFIAYKYPKLHLMRILFFLFALFVITDLIIPIRIESKSLYYFTNIIIGLAGLLITFVAGRLDKIKKNVPIMYFVGILLFIERVIINISMPAYTMNILRTTSQFNILVVWIALSLSYVARYDEYRKIHKDEIGIE